ncbi:hypothetical protein CR970_02860 [Candidatus Saccharibacteria bacterium]|nr:MAG: hypothetical protein CR970_02860 [Candidatus Saccharibacteria bacterium]
MKILMLGWELPPHNSGGLGVACYHMCKALSASGADIDFVLPYTAKHDVDFMRINAAHPQDVASVQRSGIAYDSFKYTKHNGDIQWVDLFGQTSMYEESVARIAAISDHQVIHAHDWLTCRAALRAREASGKPLIVHFHSIESDRAGKEYGGNPMVREIERMAALLADRVIAVSEHTKRGMMREYGIPGDRIDVVHNSMDIGSMDPLDPDNAYTYLTAMKQRGYRVVTYVGRLTVQKGVPNLLRAFQKVIHYQPKTILLLVGAGEQYYELIELSAQLGISQNVLFADFQRGKRWRDAYAIGDLFVMPSVSEPFGLTPLEAIGYGSPALISKQSGVAEILHNALKVDFWDIDEMANQITAVVQNDALRDELHSNAYTEFVNLSWNHAAEKIMKIYKQHAEGSRVLA